MDENVYRETIGKVFTEEEKTEMLNEVYTYLENVVPKITLLAERVRDGVGANLVEVPDLIDGVVYIWQNLVVTMDVHHMNLEDYNINGLCKDVMEGFENADFNLVGDLLEYEYLPMFKEWKEKLGRAMASR